MYVYLSRFHEVVDQNGAEILLVNAQHEAVAEVSVLAALVAELDADANYVKSGEQHQNQHPKVQEHENLFVHDVLRQQTKRVDILNGS